MKQLTQALVTLKNRRMNFLIKILNRFARYSIKFNKISKFGREYIRQLENYKLHTSYNIVGCNYIQIMQLNLAFCKIYKTWRKIWTRKKLKIEEHYEKPIYSLIIERNIF